MVAQIKENVYPNISQLKLRRLTKYDYQQFRDALIESKESISTFLDIGIELPKLNTVEFMNFYTRMIKEVDREHFGVFHGYKLLAYASYGEGFDHSGVQIIYWVREDYLRQNIGIWTIGTMTSKSWVERDDHYTQLVIDKTNYASRRVAKIMGYFPLISVNYTGQGTKGSGTYITYIHLNPKLNIKAAVHNMRPIDLIGHLAFIEDFQHLIYDEKVNEYFRWKLPLYVEDDLNEDGTFKDWIHKIDPQDPSNDVAMRLIENVF